MIFLLAVFSVSNIFPVYAIDTIYRFFPTIDDKNAIVSIQPSAKGLWKYEVITNVSQYENLPKFKKMLFEIWRKQKDGTYKNLWNTVYDKSNITDEWIVGSFSEELHYLWQPILEWDTVKKEYVTFKKIEIPFYKWNNLQKTFFDVSFKSMDLIHEKDNTWKVWPIKLVKKNFNKAVEVQLTLEKPGVDHSVYKYDVNVDTSKLPFAIRQLLAKRQFDKLYIRDWKQNYYNYVVNNKFQFWLDYSSESPANYWDDPWHKSFENLWKSYYYFSDLWRWTPTSNNITTMIKACNDKGGKLDNGNELAVGNSTVLDYFLSVNKNRKAYWVFWIRICKKDDPVYPTLKLVIEVPKDEFDAAGKLPLFFWIAWQQNLSKVYYNENKLNWTEFSTNINNIVPIIKPQETLIFDEKLAWITPKENDKLKIDVLNNRIYYYQYDPDYQRYKAPKEYVPLSIISKDILVLSNKNAQYKIQVNKFTNRYKMFLDMTPYPYGEYMLKLTPIYDDNYFIWFKAVNKCYPELITDADKLLFDKIKSKDNKLMENKITDILSFKDKLFDYLVKHKLYKNTLLYSDKLNKACNDVPTNNNLAEQINKSYLDVIWAKSVTNKTDLQQICYFLINNWRYTNVSNGTKLTYDLKWRDLQNIKSLSLEITPKNYSKDLTYNVDNNIIPWYTPSVSLKYRCLIRDANTWKITKKNVFEQIQLNWLNKIWRNSYNTLTPFNAESIRYYYSY